MQRPPPTNCYLLKIYNRKLSRKYTFQNKNRNSTENGLKTCASSFHILQITKISASGIKTQEVIKLLLRVFANFGFGEIHIYGLYIYRLK